MTATAALGLATSYSQCWNHLKTVAAGSSIPELPDGHTRILTYDNLNMTKNVAHELVSIQHLWEASDFLINVSQKSILKGGT